MKSVFIALWCFCFMLVAVIGCDQEMNMMKPAVQDVMDSKPEDIPDTTVPVAEVKDGEGMMDPIVPEPDVEEPPMAVEETPAEPTDMDPVVPEPDVTNIAPIFTDGDETTRSVAENTTSGENLGDIISATDADSGDTLTYSLGGTDAASFTIDTATGQLQTKAALDYETKDSYSVTVFVSDGKGGTDSIDVVINITDVSEVGATIYNVGDIISTLPTGLLRGRFSTVGGGLTQFLFADGRIIVMDNGTKLIYYGYTYTCVGEGECQILGNEVTKGTIERTSADN